MLILHAFLCELNKGCHSTVILDIVSDIELAYKDQSSLSFLMDLII